ncbi:MAG: hypothetical protein P1V51_00720 [Deltaproteobacteria bacterium]|nr:hypothetical protein [Deltaproteobacteria bacterium]
MRNLVVPALLLTIFSLPACGGSLPSGWEEATRIDGLVQAECAGDPYQGTHDERLEAAVGGGGIQVEYKEAHFRCEQEVEAFERRAGQSIDLLVQPRDLTPKAVAGCDCLYDISFSLVDVAGETTLTLYRRWDDLNDPNEPVLIGSATLTVP